MCGRYTLTSQAGIVDDLETALDPSVQASEWWKPRFNVAPTQPAPVVTLRDGVRICEMMRWGLVPHWATRPSEPGKRPPLMINARIDSLDKPVFRDSMTRGRRCLVVADGFFEWKRDRKPPIPFFFRPVPRRVIAFAGLWTRARKNPTAPSDDGERIISFAMITGPANPLVETIHDRMPVVLDPSVYAAWLDPSLDADGARALLDIPPVADWHADEVSIRVNKADNDDPSNIIPVHTDEPAQQKLF
ncbi:MAG TPA: SOS response-associated peptidase [Kofleriaceae bacterium]|nr:SOS response-associated peptidase [Kofleriaceae bacterium]